MDKKTLTFVVPKNVADTFSLAVSIAEKDPNEVFEIMAKQYAITILSGINSLPVDQNSSFNNYNNLDHKNSFSGDSKANKKVPLWARKLNQINSQIIRAYFLVEVNGIASRSKMRDLFLRSNPDKTVYQFESNLASMATEKANSHGHIFDFYGDEVHLANNAKRVVLAHRDMFLL